MVEREAYACAGLAKLMQEEVLDDCPIWTDLATFDGRPWRGRVHIAIAGLPCQPYSVSGRQRGDADERYIWPAFFRFLEETKPALVFIENVANLLKWFQPIGDRLSEMGYRFTSDIFTTQEMGGSHERQRLFVVAYAEGFKWWTEFEPAIAGLRWTGFAGAGRAMADTDCDGRQRSEQSVSARGREGWQNADRRSGAMANTNCGPGSSEQQHAARERQGSAAVDESVPERSGQRHNAAFMGDTTSPRHAKRSGRKSRSLRNGGGRTESERRSDVVQYGATLGAGSPAAGGCGIESNDAPATTGHGSEPLGDTAGQGLSERRSERHDTREECSTSERTSHAMADADSAGAARLGEQRRQGAESPGEIRPRTSDDGMPLAFTDGEWQRESEGLHTESWRRITDGGGPFPGIHVPYAPPGPGESDRERWRTILDEYPELAPAIERHFRRMVNGTPVGLDGYSQRIDRLRAVGNGVHPLTAAFAFQVLAVRLGIGTVNPTTGEFVLTI